MFLVGVVLLFGALALFGLVVIGHLSIPYAVIAKHRRGETGGVSGLLGVDWFLLLVAVLFARVTGVFSAGTLLLVGSCVIVGSYVHFYAAYAIYAWLERRSRLPKMRARLRE